MEIKHHLNDQILMAYTAGTLPEAFDLVIATHVSMCDECRARLQSFEAVGGHILDDAEVADLSEDSLAATLALIAEGPKEPIRAPRRTASRVPAPLQDYVGDDLAAVKWRGVGSGVKQAIIETGPDATARLLYIPAGVAMPDHGHRGTELTLVLQGAFEDADGRFARGDVEIADQLTDHAPVAAEGEDCICLIATDAKLRFNSLIPRIAQPFLRI